jgi:L-cysteine S-thiosulfotransferase
MTTRFPVAMFVRGAVVALGAAAVLYGCASVPSAQDDAALTERTIAMMKASFKPKGQAGMDRLNQDDVQRICSEYADKKLPDSLAKKIEEESLAAVRYPADGKMVGDWKEGEKVAELGQGMQFSDDPKKPNGANCYACHQLSPKQEAYGTIGPSLYQFAKKRGFTDKTTAYAWAKVYDAEAFSACTNMPRFGQHHILTEQQIRDVVALLVDPASPVNQ